MNTVYILYNHLAGHAQKSSEKLDAINVLLADRSPRLIDVTELSSYSDFLSDVDATDEIYLCGGDGTINRFANGIGDTPLPCDVYYYGTGTGNDFLKDLGKSPDCEPFLLSPYLTNLPEVEVDGDGKRVRFINNVGFGIDGYCCEVGDKLKLESDKPVNYTSIAIGGLLGDFTPTNAVVTVDGERHIYNKVWIAPTMKGRYYGGGMMAAPSQNRSSEDGEVSLVLMYGAGKLKTLTMFPSIFSGGHLKYKGHVEVLTGHHITVEFDRPTALQIDGETVLGAVKYEVFAPKKSI